MSDIFLVEDDLSLIEGLEFEIKELCISLSVVCLFFIISGQSVVKLAADNYKQNMILHD